MPGRASWNGRWSGQENHYAIVKSLNQKMMDRMEMKDGKGYWSYRWSDGWCAVICARVIPKGERLKKSSGFCGYDWMVESLCMYGTIMDSQQIKDYHKKVELMGAIC